MDTSVSAQNNAAPTDEREESERAMPTAPAVEAPRMRRSVDPVAHAWRALNPGAPLPPGLGLRGTAASTQSTSLLDYA
jgi:hypothetical protein